MSSLRGEGQDGIAADPTPVPTVPGDGSIDAKNSINANSPHNPEVMNHIASNDHAEASGSTPADSVSSPASAPAPPTIPSDERPLPPTPTAELEPDTINPVSAEDPTEAAPATPAKLLSLPFRPGPGFGTSGSSAGEGSSSASVAASTPAPAPEPVTETTLAPEPAPASVSVPEAELERELTPPSAPVSSGASALLEPTATAPVIPHAAFPSTASTAAAAQEPVRGASVARSQYQAPLPPTPQQASSQPQQPPPPAQQPRRLSQQEYIVPRWQPDSEVMYCPICFVYFSLFTRKHHCRKCGRVVCNSCSPHRITIPHAFIVQPPEAQQARGQASAAGGVIARAAAAASAFPALGAGGVPVGGERVRLCNPCVPDPNTSPPSSSASASQYRSNTHVRSRSGSIVAGNITSGNYYSFAGPDASSARNRRQGLDFFSLSGSSSAGGSGDRRYTVSNAQNPPGAGPSSASSSRNQYYGSLPPQSSRYHHHMSLPPQPGDGTMSSASASSQRPHQQHHQHQPRYPIPEEDECPVCHLELPKRTLANFETLREQHIEECISLHSQYMMGNTSGAAGRTRAASTALSAAPSSSSGPQPTPSPSRSRRANNNNHNNAPGSGPGSGSDGSPSDSGGEVSSSVDSMGSSGSAAYSSSSPRAMAVHRHTAMFPYKATEKDCASDAECTICLEDLEVGVAMARLECFCRFHEQCIRAWFVRHPGRCPVHQHGMAD